MSIPKPEGLTEIPLPLFPHPIIMTMQVVQLIPQAKF